MGKRKNEKQSFENLKPLAHNPFAQLGAQFGITPTNKEPTQDELPKEKVAQKNSLLVREKRSINQKWITQIFHLAEPEALLKPLKKKLGAGGTISDGVLEIQGRMKDRVSKELENQGFKVRMG